MRVVRIGLTDFRNYAELELELGPGVTTLVGANGQGKTNLVEAVSYAATLGSHRVATDAPLIRTGAQRAIVRVEVDRDGSRSLIELELNPGRANRVRINRAPAPRPREVVGLLRTVVFAPEDLALVKGDPSERRRFLDDLLVIRSPRLVGVRADYDRVLKQRNSLLKSAQAVRGGDARSGQLLATLSVWDQQLLDLGADLTSARLLLAQELRPHFAAAYSQLAGADSAAELTYVPAAPEVGEAGTDRGALRAALEAALERRQRDELARGVTLVGPHRDELALALRGLPVRGYASHGESWSAALALRLASFELLRGDGPGQEPVLILDDVFAELDSRRRDRLVEVALGVEQTLVTAAVGADVPAELDGTTLWVSDGTIRTGGADE